MEETYEGRLSGKLQRKDGRQLNDGCLSGCGCASCRSTVHGELLKRLVLWVHKALSGLLHASYHEVLDSIHLVYRT